MKILKSITYRITNTTFLAAGVWVSLWTGKGLAIWAEPVQGYSSEVARLIYISLPHAIDALWATMIVLGIVLMFLGLAKKA